MVLLTNEVVKYASMHDTFCKLTKEFASYVNGTTSE
jgi:hypothetical protein